MNTNYDAVDISKIDIGLIESEMLSMDQSPCPVSHHFFPGIYIREVTLPAGSIAIGHAQKFEQLNIMLKGKVAIIDNGSIKVLEAPMMFMGKPGRKIGYIIEECVWQNIYPTYETDIDKLEETYLDKSNYFLELSEQKDIIEHLNHAEDIEDFKSLVKESGFTEEQVWSQSINASDQIEMPNEYASYISIRDSSIHGKGLFANYPIKIGEIIAPARVGGMRTPAGRFTNHKKTPNAKFVMDNNGDINLVAIMDIKGCLGGSKGEEITVNYRQALSLSGIYLGKYRKCLE